MRLAEHRINAFKLVKQIGELVGVNAGLYVFAGGVYQQLALETMENFIPGPYGYGGEGKSFLVAEAGQGRCTVESARNSITGFKLVYFPGCCALCISTGTRVFTPYARRGVNKLGLQLRMALAGAYNYKALVCTDVARNTPSIRTIEGAGFAKIYEGRNKRTENLVNLYIKEIP